MIMCVGVPLRARTVTVLEMVHMDGRAGWRTRELRALSEVCCEHLLCAKGSHDASVRVQARV